MVGSISMLGLAHCSPSEPEPTTCIGPPHAQHFAVYLHGMDGRTPSSQETDIRQTLEKVAHELDLRIALPRAQAPCPDNPWSICWVWDNWSRDHIQATLSRAIERGKETCSQNARDVGLIGFSNGGILINQIVQQCLPTQATWSITLGAFGGWPTHSPEVLTGCAPLTMVMGTNDTHHYELGKKFFQTMESRGAPITMLEHPGAHEVPLATLKQALQSVLGDSHPAH